MQWHCLSKEEVLKKLKVLPDSGLSEKEAFARQQAYGKNILEAKKGKSLLVRFFAQFADFMILILILAAIISFIVSYFDGEPDFVDPVIILCIITVNASLGVLQEARAEKALEALKKMSAPTAHVLRDKHVLVIDSSELVPGDIILLETGCFVPADGRLLSSVNLRVEEASLTGESHPVEKNAEVILKPDTGLGDRINMVLATSTVTYGRGLAVVTETGMNTQVGHIAKLIMEDETPMTPLQKRLAKTGKILGIAALVICAVIFIMGIIKQLPIFDMFMTSVSLAVAAIPEGLPAIVTIMLSLGVQRMAKKNSVIRKLPAVETLGSATVICSDKTGTLTQNIMTVTEICSLNGTEKMNSDFGTFLLSHAALCNDAILQEGNNINVSGEPTEKALVLAAYHHGSNKNILDTSYQRVHEIPFDSARKLMTTVHKSKDHTYRSITKGAFDFMINRCTTVYQNGKHLPITNKEKNRLIALNNSMTEKALRVIAIAYKNISRDKVKASSSELENGLTFIGLIGMIDPPREEVKDAVRLCRQAGIKPVMITGDHVLTAKAIAKELGILANGDEAITGDVLQRMSNEELSDNIYRYSVFARVSPEHKVRIVKAFQSRGEVVAMTGDGVNDAPALKTADIGCAMGITGTDVAKNAADMILTDDNFATIVSAVKEGRGIYDNIKKAVHFLLSSNIGEILTIFVAIILGLPTPLIAVQLLWVNLVTDSLPAISLGVEPTAKDIMKKKPVSPSKGLFADGLAIRIIIEGIMIGSLALLAFVIGYYYYDLPTIQRSFAEQNISNALPGVYTPWVGRTMAFAVLSLSQLFHSFNMRSEYSLASIGLFSNRKLVYSFLICAFLQVSVITIPPLAKVFQVVPLSFRQWAITLLLSMAPIVIVEFQKILNARYHPQKNFSLEI
ncbi:calcium-translocating P-type ATPase, PMCA-type [Lachnospiraceae bacterium MD1]|jgi:Ca2+-transporting ATPase|uniref:P-type Ca(2+) transporter n=1 Tax=Variimorphobacter saccharofermentans TaxID=2755051 RepID=A0A839JYW2_9FIRM|nr:calcium-translocating P-type ATPase, PMCA-type [Variimorphobacter saccharofermentans]MBB2182554.1 calcium-translocating P-type ATPase, PMCA-type [Variimorphobacter saccharofermentans]